MATLNPAWRLKPSFVLTGYVGLVVATLGIRTGRNIFPVHTWLVKYPADTVR